MTDSMPDPALGGKPAIVTIQADWKSRAADWLFAQSSVVIVLVIWLGWTIVDGERKEKARIESAQLRQLWEAELFHKIDVRFTEISRDFQTTIKDILAANERKTERDETRFDKIVEKIRQQ